MPQTQSLKEERVKIGQIIKPQASKAGHCASWSSQLSCLQLWHKAYPSGGSDRRLLLVKDSKKPSVRFGSHKRSNQQRYQFSRMLLLGPFRTTHSYFDISVSICPSSVSHYKWTLSKHPSVHAKRKVTIFNCCRDISHPVFLRGPERTV